MDIEYKNRLLAKYKDIADKDLEEETKHPLTPEELEKEKKRLGALRMVYGAT
jgi:hypothetical protein